MKKATKLISGILAGSILLFATTAFIISGPRADFVKEGLRVVDQISLSDISTENSAIGNFQSSVRFRQSSPVVSSKEFYGQEIIIGGNPKVDRILIGVTNNLISRAEIWNNNELIETQELGFMGKMTWGETQTMTVAFHDQSNARYPGKSNISMRFHSGTGFLGDIGTIGLDLTQYGDMTGDKELKVFAKSLEDAKVNHPDFTDFKIWKNHKAFD